MKKIISKADIRRQLQEQVDDFLGCGGEVTEVERGHSGRINPNAPLKPGSFSEAGRGERTYLNEVVAELDARKKPPKPEPKKRHRQRRKKLIYDDFGEPLRWEWVEE
jgi:hypothetical protein